MRVGLFVTCLVDLIRPSVGFAAVKLLEQAGCSVEVPRQSCCGQPAFNSGDRATTRDIAEQVIEAFAPFDYVVAPSGSCAGMLKVHYPELFRGDPNWQPRADAFAAKTYELVSFLVDVCGVEERRVAACRRPRPITMPAPGCANSACARQPRRLLVTVAGPHPHRNARRRCLLRIWRHVLRQISRHLHRHRRQEGRQYRGDRRRPVACRRSRLPYEHGRQAAARRAAHRSPPCRRGARRDDARAGDRHAGETAASYTGARSDAQKLSHERCH